MRSSRITRRQAVVSLGAFAVAMSAGEAGASPQAVRDWLAAHGEGKPAQAGRIVLDLPEVAENGASVPLAVSVQSPMTAAEHVTDLWVAADGNPNPAVVSLAFGPDSGKAAVQLRIRLAQSQTVHALARMSDGSLWSARREVKVTTGGCGAG